MGRPSGACWRRSSSKASWSARLEADHAPGVAVARSPARRARSALSPSPAWPRSRARASRRPPAPRAARAGSARPGRARRDAVSAQVDLGEDPAAGRHVDPSVVAQPHERGGVRRPWSRAPPRPRPRPWPARPAPSSSRWPSALVSPTCCVQRSRSAAPLRAERGGIAARSSSEPRQGPRRAAPCACPRTARAARSGRGQPRRWRARSCGRAAPAGRARPGRRSWSSTRATNEPAPARSSRAVAGYSSIE